ncbi:LADA_0H08856g1_1 [Lachancea dasiensis]|uniref:LADA_0H08856g1_1 n=1 Tax=Lachancea dasiensis TaxID=1072105 RepID=A0A1G4K2L8_9SACH|nr:LADA_0H08856g1_1 [Lachancea dasiensis]
MSASPVILHSDDGNLEAPQIRKRVSQGASEDADGPKAKRKSVKNEEQNLSPVEPVNATTKEQSLASSNSSNGAKNKRKSTSEGNYEKSTSGETKLATSAPAGPTGHRPVTSCTHCRQHKIKCNASEKFPAACSRCERMGLTCEVDPQFKPKKGSQLQSLRNDVDELKLKVECLAYNESLIARALEKTEWGQKLLQSVKLAGRPARRTGELRPKGPLPVLGRSSSQPKISVQTYLAQEPQLLHRSTGAGLKDSAVAEDESESTRMALLTDPTLLNDDTLPPVLRTALKHHALKYSGSHDVISQSRSRSMTPDNTGSGETIGTKPHVVATTSATQPLVSPQAGIDEFVLGDVRISISRAEELHKVFVESFLPYFPIMYSNSATELYSQSQLLFWTVILTACLSEPEPTLYNQLASLIKQLAIETCWIRTPRSTHISQALLILCNWPLPNEKVLDDCSYRFVGLAKSLSFQLGLHRGKFMSEFSRTQTSMPDAEKWRTRTWLGIFFTEQSWASILGLPPTSRNDYLVEMARLQEDEGIVPTRFRRLICLANYQAELCETVGSSVSSPDGLLDAKERPKALDTMEKELDRLRLTLKFEEDTVTEIYYLYVQLMICCFAFLPGTSTDHQKQYVEKAYLSATKVVTLLTKLLERSNLIQLPIYVRQSVTYSALILFKLQLTPLLADKHVDSARQSIVTVHRLCRNQLTAWTASVENDISRTAGVLEKLNFVLISQPEIFIESEGIISRMRSHLTGTLFYDLVWCIHEARRRQNDSASGKEETKMVDVQDDARSKRKLFPLPFYNQISKEDFETITKTTPGGTTITTLVPTENAIQQAKKLAKSQGNRKGPIKYINGIPISVLDETGSMKFDAASMATPGVALCSDVSSPHTPYNSSKPSATTEDVMPRSPSLFTQPMQRSASTPAVAEPSTGGRRVTSISPSLVSGNTNSLFAVNSTGLPPLATNKAASPDFVPPGPPLLPSNSFSTFNMFLNEESGLNSNSATNTHHGATPVPTQIFSKQSSELNMFFQAQSAGWMERNSASDDDFLGWFDINMAPEF